jgi:uncharacterized protein YceK
MKQRLLLRSLLLTTLLASGCTSIRTRTELPAADWKIYPGVQRDVADLGLAFEGKLKGPAWTPVMVVPILIADAPFSGALDTLALPYDLYRLEAEPETPH